MKWTLIGELCAARSDDVAAVGAAHILASGIKRPYSFENLRLLCVARDKMQQAHNRKIDAWN